MNRIFTLKFVGVLYGIGPPDISYMYALFSIILTTFLHSLYRTPTRHKIREGFDTSFYPRCQVASSLVHLPLKVYLHADLDALNFVSLSRPHVAPETAHLPRSLLEIFTFHNWPSQQMGVLKNWTFSPACRMEVQHQTVVTLFLLIPILRHLCKFYFSPMIGLSVKIRVKMRPTW